MQLLIIVSIQSLNDEKDYSRHSNSVFNIKL
jgi:hypothetical protein